MGRAVRVRLARENSLHQPAALHLLDDGRRAARRLVAKVRIAPAKEFADRVVRRTLDVKSALHVYRPQLCTDLAHMPVEDVTVPWPETLSPFVTVAKLRLPQQDIGGDDNLELQDATSMSAWRVTEEHRPLGNTMRVR